jgi:hypothetical protein
MPGDQTENFLSALRAYWHESSDSFYTISAQMGVSYSSLSKWLHHGVEPTAANLNKIERFLKKYGPDYLTERR